MAKQILIVEDEPNIVESLSFVLSREGFDVRSLDNGAEAVDAISTNTPDVLVLDVMLPGLNGFEVLRRLREDMALTDLPVLMLTAKGQRRDREVAETVGANIFITKPFANTDVVDAVRRLAG